MKIKYWFQRRTRGWSDDETWCLDNAFMEWVNSRFTKYKELAGSIVDLEYFKFKYKGKEYTQIELIDKIINLSGRYIYLVSEEGYVTDELLKIKTEVLEIFTLIFDYMNW